MAMDAKTFLYISELCALFAVINLVQFLVFYTMGSYFAAIMGPTYMQLLYTLDTVMIIALSSVAVTMFIIYLVKKSQE